jgi:apolipoprotein N-acyltransferase
MRCTNTGVTASMDSFGRVTRWLPPFQELFASKQIKIPNHGTETFYTRHGEIFSIGCAILSAFAIILHSLLLLRRDKVS